MAGKGLGRNRGSFARDTPFLGSRFLFRFPSGDDGEGIKQDGNPMRAMNRYPNDIVPVIVGLKHLGERLYFDF